MDRSQAEASEAFLVVLEPKEAPPLHVHEDTEQIFYVLRGAGTLYIGAGAPQRFRVKVGDLVRIPPRTLHRIRCSGREKLVYLSVDCFPGGRPKDEPTWESHVRVMCARNGWDFDKVRK
jgi:mannose-6-phosphate isomerase-like protein (cupin superfamily)